VKYKHSYLQDCIDPDIYMGLYSYLGSRLEDVNREYLFDISMDGVNLDDNVKLSHLKYIYSIITEEQRKDFLIHFGNTDQKPLDFLLSIRKKLTYRQLFLIVAKYDSFYKKYLNNEITFTISNKVFGCNTFELFSHQLEIVLTSIKLVKNNNDFLIQMPTGTGKTVTALMLFFKSILIEKFEKEINSFIWLAPTKELVIQAIETFSRLWSTFGKDEAHIVDLSSLSSVRNFPPGYFIFGTFAKLSKIEADLDSESRHSIKYAFLDEAHRIEAPTFKNALSKLKRAGETVFIGLTATPGRNAYNPRANTDLSNNFSKNIVCLNNEYSIPKLIETGFLSNIKHIIIESNYMYETSIKNKYDNLSNRSLINLSIDVNRNKRIINIISEEALKGRKIIVFSCNLQHSKLLKYLLHILGISSNYVDSNTVPSERARIISEFKSSKCKILINFDLFTTGFDAPDTDVLVLTRPTTSIITYSQMIGRVLRGPKVGGSKTSKIYEFIEKDRLRFDFKQLYTYFSDYWNVK